MVTHSKIWEQDRVLEMPADQVLTYYAYRLDKAKKEKADIVAQRR
jgi:hypothetical protein